jgi:hypothetical protein
MGLALDEPRDGDSSYEINEVPLVADPFAMKLIREAGGINIKSGIFGPTAELDNSSCGTGGCSC